MGLFRNLVTMFGMVGRNGGQRTSWVRVNDRREKSQMKSDRSAGAALIAGSIGFIVTMGLHPSGDMGGHAHLTVGVHALAIASLFVQAYGFLRFVMVARLERQHVDAGFVVFAVAALFGSLAATVSGILSPALAERLASAPTEEQTYWHVVLTYNFQLNAALTQVFIAAASVAMIIWSTNLFRISRSWTALGAAGIVVGTISLLALFSGHIRNNVHDVGLFVLGFSAWTITLGVFLCRPITAGRPLTAPQ